MNESKSLAERAKRRIRAIAERHDLATNDPLMAEIALAQVDATLAVAAALLESQQRTNHVEVVNPHHFPSGGGGGDRLRTPDFGGLIARNFDLERQLAKANKTIEELRLHQPWWRRIFP